jgi:hypothetical protein
MATKSSDEAKGAPTPAACVANVPRERVNQAIKAASVRRADRMLRGADLDEALRTAALRSGLPTIPSARAKRAAKTTPGGARDH